MAKALVVRFTLRPGAAEDFDELVAATVAQIRAKEPGTLVYVSHELPDRPEVRIFYELYRDEDAFQEHEAQPHTRHFLEEREQYLDDVSVDFAQALAGCGVPALGVAE